MLTQTIKNISCYSNDFVFLELTLNSFENVSVFNVFSMIKYVSVVNDNNEVIEKYDGYALFMQYLLKVICPATYEFNKQKKQWYVIIPLFSPNDYSNEKIHIKYDIDQKVLDTIISNNVLIETNCLIPNFTFIPQKKLSFTQHAFNKRSMIDLNFLRDMSTHVLVVLVHNSQDDIEISDLAIHHKHHIQIIKPTLAKYHYPQLMFNIPAVEIADQNVYVIPVADLQFSMESISSLEIMTTYPVRLTVLAMGDINKIDDRIEERESCIIEFLFFIFLFYIFYEMIVQLQIN